MNILGILKALVGAITAAFLAISGTGATPQPQDIAQVASTTDAVVQEAAIQATSTTPTDISQAYELGKAVGKLQAQADQIKSQATMTMTENNMPQTPPQVIVSPQSTGAQIPSPQAVVISTPQPVAPAQQTPAPAPAATVPASQARMDIINPLPGKGVGPRIDEATGADKGYIANPTIVMGTNPDGSRFVAHADNYDESNEIVLGAVVYDDTGNPTDSRTVSVAATDSSQDKTMNGTGVVTPIWVDGDRRVVPVYMYTYDFKTAGQHTITFTSGLLTASVTVQVK